MYFFEALFPLTALGWTVQIIVSIIATYILLSFAEYLIHRFLMHEGLPQSVGRYFPFLAVMVHDHRTLHHETYYQQFDYEPDHYGRDVNLILGWHHTAIVGLFFLPLFLTITWFVSLVPMLVFYIGLSLHTVVWNAIHTEMHQPKHPFWSKWGVYAFLKNYHYQHHQNPHSYFNIVCPLMDSIFGTEASRKDTAQEIQTHHVSRGLGYIIEG